MVKTAWREKNRDKEAGWASMGRFTGKEELHLTKAQGMCRRAVRGKASKWQHQTVEGLAY